jgi:hypothetical protein
MGEADSSVPFPVARRRHRFLDFGNQSGGKLFPANFGVRPSL